MYYKIYSILGIFLGLFLSWKIISYISSIEYMCKIENFSLERKKVFLMLSIGTLALVLLIGGFLALIYYNILNAYIYLPFTIKLN